MEHIDQMISVETLIDQWPDEDLVRDESAAMRSYMEHEQSKLWVGSKSSKSNAKRL